MHLTTVLLPPRQSLGPRCIDTRKVEWLPRPSSRKWRTNRYGRQHRNDRWRHLRNCRCAMRVVVWRTHVRGIFKSAKLSVGAVLFGSNDDWRLLWRLSWAPTIHRDGLNLLLRRRTGQLLRLFHVGSRFGHNRGFFRNWRGTISSKQRLQDMRRQRPRTWSICAEHLKDQIGGETDFLEISIHCLDEPMLLALHDVLCPRAPSEHFEHQHAE